MLDGKEILPSERIKAVQRLPDLEHELVYAIEEYKIKKEQQEHEAQLKQGDDDKEAYTRESRKKMYLDMAKEKEEQDKRQNPEKYEPKKEPTPMYLSNGAVRQCDEGGYKPLLNEWDDPEYTTFRMKIPKYLDTSLVELQLFPMYISVRVKGKLT